MELLLFLNFETSELFLDVTNENQVDDKRSEIFFESRLRYLVDEEC